MTTFEDLDLAEAFGDDFTSQDEPARRHAGWITAVAMSLAALLVAGGLVWLVGHRQPVSSTSPVVTAAVAVPALDAPQGLRDQIRASALDGTGVRAESTRYLGTTSMGAVFAGVGAHGHLCLITVPVGDLPSTACTKPHQDTVIVLRPTTDGPAVAYATAGATAPDTADGWTEVTDGLWFQAAKP